MKIKIRNCNYFTYECNLEWDTLQLIDQEGVRLCAVCEKKVFFCDTNEQIHEAIALGRCIAIEDEDRPPRMGYVSC